MIFVREVGAHHIYDDTCFCHNYRHRSVISMTEKVFVWAIMSQMCLFFVVMHPSAGSVPLHLHNLVSLADESKQNYNNH
jgi:hypothetical protein